MICLDNTDTIEAWSGTDAVVDYTIHGLVGTTFTQLAAGVLGNVADVVIYTAEAATSVVSIIFVNTDTSAVTVNCTLDPADGGNPRYLIPKTVSLGARYSLHTDGVKFNVVDPTGAIAYTYHAHTHDGDTLQLDGVNSDGGAFAFTTSGLVTFSQNITFAGQLGFPAALNASADPNTLDDYRELTWPMGITFGGAAVGITYSLNTGYYTKIGNLVTISGYLILTSKGTSVGDALITGLPFLMANNYAANVALPPWSDDMTFANQFQMYINRNTDFIVLEQVTEGGVRSAITNANFTDTSKFQISATYRVK